MTEIVVYSDAVVRSGQLSWTAEDLAIHVWNANNHHIPWGVLGAPVHAIEDFMFYRQHWGAASFEIFDGVNQVAQGMLGQPTVGSSSQGSIP